jgi:Na+-driven multidrug efflux pump
MWVIWLEWCAFEFLTFFSGYLDVDSTAAQILLFNFECLIYMPALSLSIAAGANVGKYVGAGDVSSAKRAAKIAQKITCIELLV